MDLERIYHRYPLAAHVVCVFTSSYVSPSK
jgi:hypothetical protein